MIRRRDATLNEPMEATFPMDRLSFTKEAGYGRQKEKAQSFLWVENALISEMFLFPSLFQFYKTYYFNLHIYFRKG